MSELAERARVFAIAAHAGVSQVRKYTGEPYWHHPMQVAAMVAGVTNEPEAIAAAWLHDVVEDTGVSIELIQEMFGYVVRRYVEDLTDVSKPEDGPRRIRKAIDREHTAKACPTAMTIKLADLIDNTRSIVERDPGFARVYLAEKHALLHVLRPGNAELWRQANTLLQHSAGRIHGLDLPRLTVQETPQTL